MVFVRYFNQRTPCEVRRKSDCCIICFSIFQSTHHMRGVRDKHDPIFASCNFNQRTPARCNQRNIKWTASTHKFQSNAPRAGCNSKTIQFKRILVARRMYSFANYALRTLKHLSTYCIGTTLQLFFWCEASSNFMFTWGSHHFDNSIIAYTVLLCIRFCGNKKEPPFTSKIMPHLK